MPADRHAPVTIFSRCPLRCRCIAVTDFIKAPDSPWMTIGGQKLDIEPRREFQTPVSFSEKPQARELAAIVHSCGPGAVQDRRPPTSILKLELTGCFRTARL